jgi:hypothetical protein
MLACERKISYVCVMMMKDIDTGTLKEAEEQYAPVI